MPRIALLTLLVVYLPGALLFRVPVGGRSHASLPAEERGFWQIVLSLVWSSIVGLSLAASGVYRFERLLVINGLLCLVIAGIWRTRLRLDQQRRGPHGRRLRPQPWRFSVP